MLFPWSMWKLIWYLNNKVQRQKHIALPLFWKQDADRMENSALLLCQTYHGSTEQLSSFVWQGDFLLWNKECPIIWAPSLCYWTFCYCSNKQNKYYLVFWKENNGEKILNLLEWIKEKWTQGFYIGKQWLWSGPCWEILIFGLISKF